MNLERLAALLLAVCLAGAAGCDQPDGDPADAAAADGPPADAPPGADVAPADVAVPPDAAAGDVGGVGDTTPDLTAVGLGFALPGGELYPEGIAVARDGTFYVGSLREGLVLKASPASWMRGVPFIPAGSNGLVGVLGLIVEDATSTLWVCSSDMPVARLAGSAPTALKAFDLASGAPKGSYPFPGGGRCNDLTVDSRGNVYATDSSSPRLLRLPRGGAALEVWLEGEVLAGYLNGITVDSRDRLYLVLSDAGGLIRFAIQPDGRPGPVERVALSRKLSGPDGVEMLDDATAVVVENSWQFSTIALREVPGGTIEGTIHQRARVRRPTTFALHGGAAWIVEGQLVSLNNPDAGGAPLLPFVVYRVELAP
jgi:hypothetical protein